jgi:hypothetical protein
VCLLSPASFGVLADLMTSPFALLLLLQPAGLLISVMWVELYACWSSGRTAWAQCVVVDNLCIAPCVASSQWPTDRQVLKTCLLQLRGLPESTWW